jgi:hypothetical protein
MFQPFSGVRRPLCALLLVLGCSSPQKPPPAVVEPFPEQPQNPFAFAPVPPIFLRDVGLSAPSAALYDPTADVYLVSNVGGGLADADNDGFISRVSPDGAMLELRWIDAARSGSALNAPKGMALIGDTLFVADIETLRAYDRTSGKSLGDVVFPGATFLEDIAAGAGGILFVTDGGLGKRPGSTELGKSGTDAVYVVDAQRAVKALARGADLGEPTALCVTKGRLLVAARGGDVFTVDRQGQRVSVGKAPGGDVHGMVLTPGGRLLVTSAAASAVYITPAGLGQSLVLEPLLTDIETPGDLGYDPKRRQIIVPLTRPNALYIQELPGGIN